VEKLKCKKNQKQTPSVKMPFFALFEAKNGIFIKFSKFIRRHRVQTHDFGPLSIGQI
jgi:hypothetical protein